MKTCPRCGQQNDPGRRFCEHCGIDVQAELDHNSLQNNPVMLGAVFDGKFKILSELGRGGMGIVYRGKDTSLGRFVAIKVLPEKFNTETEIISRFKKEAQAMARLDHPNIVPVYAIGQQENFHYFAMKHLEGETIAQLLDRMRLRNERFSSKEVRSIIIQICKGLDHAHNQGLIHRDIKPGNIMLSPEGHATIMDFGIVKEQAGDDNLTRTGLVFGTPEYMAPEQAQGLAPPGPTTDLYSVGVVAYEMLKGTPPFEGDTPFSVVFKHIKDPPPPLIGHIPGIDPDLQKIIFRALEKDPSQRFTQAREMWEALELLGRRVQISRSDPMQPLQDIFGTSTTPSEDQDTTLVEDRPGHYGGLVTRFPSAHSQTPASPSQKPLPVQAGGHPLQNRAPLPLHPSNPPQNRGSLSHQPSNPSSQNRGSLSHQPSNPPPQNRGSLSHQPSKAGGAAPPQVQNLSRNHRPSTPPQRPSKSRGQRNNPGNSEYSINRGLTSARLVQKRSFFPKALKENLGLSLFLSVIALLGLSLIVFSLLN